MTYELFDTSFSGEFNKDGADIRPLPRIFEMVDDEILLAPSDISSLLGIHVETVRRWCRKGKLRTLSPMGKYMIRGSDLKVFLYQWYRKKIK